MLNILATDPDYKFYMLDGQTIVLDDYLQVRPEREGELRLLVQSGRLLIGPWHVLPDEFLVSPESIIRNLLQGERTSRRFGSKMQVGYIPDPFGHIGQMPQILAGFGIPFAAVQRGLDDQPCELFWKAPNGSQVLLVNLRDGYGNAASLPTSDPPAFLEQIYTIRDSLSSHNFFPHLLIMHGTDHMLPQPNTSAALAYTNQRLGDDILIHSNLPDYFAALQSFLSIESKNPPSKPKIPTITGELRSSKRHHLLPGVLSARVWIKQRNHQCETLLEKWAEPFSTISSLVAHDSGQAEPSIAASKNTEYIHNPAPLLRHAWQLLMECHPHDSICGCSIDQVHDEMRPRFDQVEQIAEEIIFQSLEILATQINTTSLSSNRTPRGAIIIFNPNIQTNTGLTTVTLPVLDVPGSTEIRDENGQVLLHQVVATHIRRIARLDLNRQGLLNLLSGVTNGKVTGLPTADLAIQDIHLSRKADTLQIDVAMTDGGEPNPDALNLVAPEMAAALSDASLDHFTLEANVVSSDVRFLAVAVPPVGYKTIFYRHSVSTSPHPSPDTNSSSGTPSSINPQSIVRKSVSRTLSISNEFFTVDVSASDGTLTLTDRRDGTIYNRLNHFIDGGDCGDEYNYCPPAADQLIFAKPGDIQVEATSLGQSIRINLELPIPIELAPDRYSRSIETAPLAITTSACLSPGIPRLEIHTEVNNPCKDHRLRVHFPVPFGIIYADYDGHFEVVRRPVGVPPHDQTWAESPRPEVPQRFFTAVSGGQRGLILANRGLREVEASSKSSLQAEIALTLLRCVGWLSRDDFPARKGHAGPQLATPGAQMLGRWSFDYALIPFLQGDELAAYHQAFAFNAPLRAVTTGLHKGVLPSKDSFINIFPSSFVLSTIKETEDGTGWIMRGYNLLSEPILVTLNLWKDFNQIQRVNLAEQVLYRTNNANGSLQFTVQGHEIVTLKFSD